MHLLEQKRRAYLPHVPEWLRDLGQVVLREEKNGKTNSALQSLFPKTFDRSPWVLAKGTSKLSSPLKVGVFFSGGQASGGHNVIAGLFHAIKSAAPSSQLFGFLNGPSGVVDKKVRELKEKEIAFFFNQGGFDLIGSGRTKIETASQLESALKTCTEMSLDGLVVIGGDDSNTNAAVLAEYFLQKGCNTKVIGVPKTIDGDLQSPDLPISFGFDTACKTYSELIGNIARDALSAKKYYHFIKLMGRSASHIALECALSTHPNLALIGEERKSLDAIVEEIASLIERRREAGKEYGVILIPEGLIEFIPEIQELIGSLNQLLAAGGDAVAKLPSKQQALFHRLPEKIQKQLLLERDPHGNVQVAQIDTQELLIELVTQKLTKPFFAQGHFFGYEGRACFPSNFDATYCYALGRFAALAIRDHLTGVICTIQNLAKKVEEWRFKAVPIVRMMHLEMRKGKEKPVIQKALVDLKGAPFAAFGASRKSWEIDDSYQYPGPIQFFGDPDLTDAVPLTLLLKSH